jgi:hypothetical protein
MNSNDIQITLLIIYSYKSKNSQQGPAVGTKFANIFAGNYFALSIVSSKFL